MKNWILLTAAVLPLPLFAEFSTKNPSVNGTGEVLPPSTWELGLMKTHYGLDENWMLTAPSATALFGYGRLELKRRIRLDESQRLSPYAFLQTPRKLGIGADWGMNFSEAHTLTAGARLQITPRAYKVRKGPRSRTHMQVLPNLEYDYYTSGNVAYAGIADYLPYAGYTWAFENWHFGLIMSPYASFIPLPYLYLRF